MHKQQYIPKSQIQALAGRSDLVGWLLVVHCWGSIVLMMVMFAIWPNAITFFIAYWVISGRQLGLAILMHDAAHGLLFRSEKLNAFIGHYVLASVVGVSLPAYRKYHLKHHLYTQQENDPDLGLTAAFPITRASFVRKIIRDLSGLTALKLRIAQFRHKPDPISPDLTSIDEQNDQTFNDQAFNVNSVYTPYLANLFMLLVCYLAGYWWIYFALWLIPLLTGFQLVLRIRNIAEHAMASHSDDPLTHARTTKANWCARVLVAPYWVNYHVEHHVYMYIPCWRLKKLHRAMIGSGHLEGMEIKNSYSAVLRTVISG